MSDTPHTPFMLPDEYVEQTKSLRDKTANKLYEVRARIADLQVDELRLVSQLAAMDNIVNSACAIPDAGQESDEAHAGLATTPPGAEAINGPNNPRSLTQLPVAGLLEPTNSSATLSVDAEQPETPGIPAGSGSTAAYRSSRHSPGLARSVEAVIETLREHGPLHYRSIYDNVETMGIAVIGKDPAAVLLSRFSRDPRIRRVGSGTYAVAD